MIYTEDQAREILSELIAKRDALRSAEYEEKMRYIACFDDDKAERIEERRAELREELSQAEREIVEFYESLTL